jgi:hypothetical protein
VTTRESVRIFHQLRTKTTHIIFVEVGDKRWVANIFLWSKNYTISVLGFLPQSLKKSFNFPRLLPKNVINCGLRLLHIRRIWRRHFEEQTPTPIGSRDKRMKEGSNRTTTKLQHRCEGEQRISLESIFDRSKGKLKVECNARKGLGHEGRKERGWMG